MSKGIKKQLPITNIGDRKHPRTENRDFYLRWWRLPRNDRKGNNYRMSLFLGTDLTEFSSYRTKLQRTEESHCARIVASKIQKINNFCDCDSKWLHIIPNLTRCVSFMWGHPKGRVKTRLTTEIYFLKANPVLIKKSWHQCELEPRFASKDIVGMLKAMKSNRFLFSIKLGRYVYLLLYLFYFSIVTCYYVIYICRPHWDALFHWRWFVCK